MLKTGIHTGVCFQVPLVITGKFPLAKLFSWQEIVPVF